MKLYSYIVKKDVGLAPNPFWGYCTLAVCTPNHMGIQAQKGDWIIGTTPVSRDSKLVYVMKVSEILSFEKYYADIRFKKKKPVVHGAWRERCGDNMYYKNTQGKWMQHSTIHHRSPETIKQDLKHPVVFIADHFYYFGDRTVIIPPEFQGLIWKRQGCKRNHDAEMVRAFLSWLIANFSPGILGKPNDNDEIPKASCL